MNTVSHAPIPCNSDGLIVPRLIPVAAFLCCEEYDDTARARILERLADGVPARVCCYDGSLEWDDLGEVQRILAGRRPYGDGLPTDREWDEQCAAAELETARAAAECPPIEPYQPTEEDERWLSAQSGDEWPRLKSADERRAELAEACRCLRETAYP